MVESQCSPLLGWLHVHSQPCVDVYCASGLQPDGYALVDQAVLSACLSNQGVSLCAFDDVMKYLGDWWG